MKLPDKPYHIIEDFIEPEYCKEMLNYFSSNPGFDPRPFYANYGIGGKYDFFPERYSKPDNYNQPFDPERKLYDMVRFAYNFFVENYPIIGDFELNRCHANFMFTGAELKSHYDDRNDGTTSDPALARPIEEIGGRTHVAGLYLNDDYEGGEFYLIEHGLEIKPKVGSLVFFPGYYSQHGVKEIKSGTRVNVLAHFFDVIDKDNIGPNYML